MTSDRERVHLDVRSVEPRDRFERIMATYEALEEHETLALTVDHDPKCMYYTLKATRGDDAFDFRYLESGPETWRVEVRRKTRGRQNEEAHRERK